MHRLTLPDEASGTAGAQPERPMPYYNDEMTDRAVRVYLSDADRDSSGEQQQPDRNMTGRDGDQITIANESGTLATYRIIGEGDVACVRRVPSPKGTGVAPVVAASVARRFPYSRR